MIDIETGVAYWSPCLLGNGDLDFCDIYHGCWCAAAVQISLGNVSQKSIAVNGLTVSQHRTLAAAAAAAAAAFSLKFFACADGTVDDAVKSECHQ